LKEEKKGELYSTSMLNGVLERPSDCVVIITIIDNKHKFPACRLKRNQFRLHVCLGSSE
jgi:hypothetical protein